jgi:predicted amidophosphoribosyltransferase
VVFGKSNYSLGQKYCRRCEVYMYNDNMFCPCCGMQLRLTPSSRRCKEILRKRKTSTKGQLYIQFENKKG